MDILKTADIVLWTYAKPTGKSIARCQLFLIYPYLSTCLSASLSLDSVTHYPEGLQLLVYRLKVSRRFNFPQTSLSSLLSLLSQYILTLENIRAYKQPWLPRVPSLCSPHT